MAIEIFHIKIILIKWLKLKIKMLFNNGYNKEMNFCNNCQKTFSTKSSLTAHQKTSKSCGTELSNEECGFCRKLFSSIQNLHKHENICQSKKIQEIKEKDFEYAQALENKNFIIKEKENDFKEKELEYIQAIKDKENDFNEKEAEYVRSLKEKGIECKCLAMEKNEQALLISSLKSELKTTKEYTDKQIKDLQDRLERLTNKVIEKTTSSTVNNINITFFTQEQIDKQVNTFFSRDHLILGAKGVAKFVHEFLSKKGEKLIYTCTDPARQVFYFMSDDGTRTKDFKGARLTKALQKPICDKSLKIVKDANYSINYLNELENKDDQQILELRLYKFSLERWRDGVSTEISMLGNSNFVMEMSKLMTI